MRSSRALAVIALAAATATAAAACSGGGSGNSSSSASAGSSPADEAVTLTWWNNATTQPLLGVWQRAIRSFEAAHPNVTIKDVPIQNEQFTTKVPEVLEGSPPDIYQQWGGGQELTQIGSGKLADLSPDVTGWIRELGAAADNWQVNGQWYGVPYDFHVVGFWYRKDLFRQAGITSVPTTIAQLVTDDMALKAHGITPISVGSADRWPDAFWWEYFAIRDCPTSVIKRAMSSVSLSDSCFSKATSDLTSFMNTKPFQANFLGTLSQQGAGSSAGLVGSGKAAMELQGDWDPGVMEGVLPGAQAKSLSANLGWFPFPAVPGGQGDPKVQLGGGDGFTCTTGAAEPACSEFLRFLDTPAVQKQIMGAGAGLPANPAATSAIAFPAERVAAQYHQKAPYIAVYFDTALPTQPGQNLNNAVADFFAGAGSGQQIISSVRGPA
jgi:raffinose/stachyose/melibiose transport system substrate-binding protein